MIFVKAFKSVAVAIASLPLGGCAIAVGIIFGALLRAEAYSPELSGILFTRAMLGFGLIETFALFIVGFAVIAVVI